MFKMMSIGQMDCIAATRYSAEMSKSQKKAVRALFNQVCLERDHNTCVTCGECPHRTGLICQTEND